MRKLGKALNLRFKRIYTHALWGTIGLYEIVDPRANLGGCMRYLRLVIYIIISVGITTYMNTSKASPWGSMNPCEYMNANANIANKLDTGDDPNFDRIKQMKNRELVIACQEYEIKALEQAKNDLNRDNY